jgi:hypothetical protein
VIEASDVRPAVKEQIESLGAKFIDVPYETDEEREIAKGVGGYARPMPAAWMQRQAAAVAERMKQADIVITTALIPGRKAPILITEEMVKSMKPGSVILDMAVEQGGNCALSELGKTVTKHGVHIIGQPNLPGHRAGGLVGAVRAQRARLPQAGDRQGRQLHAQPEDDIVAACLMCTGERSSARTRPNQRARRHGSRQSHRPQPDHLRAGHLRRLPRGVERHAGAAHAADVGHQRDLGDHHRRRDARRGADRDRRSARRWACSRWRWPRSTCSAASS